MAKQPKTTSEHLISIYGYITGLRREVGQIKNNHLKHIHQDIDRLLKKTNAMQNNRRIGALRDMAISHGFDSAYKY